MTALYCASLAAKKRGVTILADGGITKSGDMVKALPLAAGVMWGGLLLEAVADAQKSKVKRAAAEAARLHASDDVERTNEALHDSLAQAQAVARGWRLASSRGALAPLAGALAEAFDDLRGTRPTLAVAGAGGVRAAAALRVAPVL